MKRIIIITFSTLIVVILLSIGYWHLLPIEINRKSDINFGNSKEQKWKTGNPTILHNGNLTEREKNNNNSDTLKIKGNYAVFLRPSDEKFKTLEEEPGIYEADSDFGFGISATLDSLDNISKYADIKSDVTTTRYIKIEDCKDCPKTIDRDSIIYGLILTAPKKNIEIIISIHSMPYLNEIDDYFNIK